MQRPADIPDLIRRSNNACHYLYLIYRRIERAMADGQCHLDDLFTFEGQREETRLSEEMQHRLVEWLRADGFTVFETVSENADRKKFFLAVLHSDESRLGFE
jgi:hypothetical protein